MPPSTKKHSAITGLARGFTLIELLVVVSIIGVLAAVVFNSLTAARAKSRDTVRYGELVQLRTAINRYYTENGSYPSTGGIWFASNPGTPPVYQSGIAGDWIPGLVSSGMIPVLPKDPQGLPSVVCAGTETMSYLYRSNGLDYKLLSHCAVEGTYPTASSPFYDPYRPNWAIQVTSDVGKTGTGCPTATTCW